MFYHENADYEIVEKILLHHNTEKSMLHIAQIVMNLIINDNKSLMILESTLSLFEQSVVVNFLSIE